MTNAFGGLDRIFTGVLGESDMFRINPEGGVSVDVMGIFTERWKSLEAGDFGDFDGATSSASVSKNDIPATILDGTKGTVDRLKTSIRYRIASVRPDEHDMVDLILTKIGPAP